MISLKELVWIGSSRGDFKSTSIRSYKMDLGYALHQAQSGYFPDYAKPLKGFSGVIEIISNFDKNTYRAVYATKLGERIYVLHAFQKNQSVALKRQKKLLS